MKYFSTTEDYTLKPFHPIRARKDEGCVRDIVRSETAEAGSGRYRQGPGGETHNEGNDPDVVEAISQSTAEVSGGIDFKGQ